MPPLGTATVEISVKTGRLMRVFSAAAWLDRATGSTCGSRLLLKAMDVPIVLDWLVPSTVVPTSQMRPHVRALLHLDDHTRELFRREGHGGATRRRN